ncbi:MAG: VVA0879 family protein [Bacteroides sp.]
MDKKTYTPEEWRVEGKRRFGGNFEDWKFKCPSCGNIASGKEYKEAGAEPNDMYQNCIGRFNGKTKGCDWAAYGLFDICTVHIQHDDGLVPVFDFAEEETK